MCLQRIINVKQMFIRLLLYFGTRSSLIKQFFTGRRRWPARAPPAPSPPRPPLSCSASSPLFWGGEGWARRRRISPPPHYTGGMFRTSVGMTQRSAILETLGEEAEVYLWLLQGDHSGCSLCLVGFKTKVVFQYMLLIVKLNFCFYVNNTYGSNLNGHPVQRRE